MDVRVNKPTKMHIKRNISRTRVYAVGFQFYKCGDSGKLFLVNRTRVNKLPDASTVNTFICQQSIKGMCDTEYYYGYQL